MDERHPDLGPDQVFPNPLIEEAWPRITHEPIDPKLLMKVFFEQMKDGGLELLLNEAAERVGRRPNLEIDKDGTVGGGEPLTLEQLKREYALANANMSAVQVRCTELKNELRQVQAQRSFTFRDLQAEAAAWTAHNFPNQNPIEPLLGMVEEIGELYHSVLKGLQGIRGTPAEHDANAKDAIADLIIFTANYCTKRGWDFQQIVESTWREVAKRDWTKNKVDGST